MNTKELKSLVNAGVTLPAGFFKRNAWTNIERVMEYLVKRGLAVRTEGDIKYTIRSGYTVEDLVKAYVASPLTSHLDEMKQLSAELHLPLNSGALLKAFNNFNL